MLGKSTLSRAAYDTSFSNHIYIIATAFQPMSGQVRVGYHLSSWWRNVPLVYFTILIDQPRLPLLHVFSKYLASFRVLFLVVTCNSSFLDERQATSTGRRDAIEHSGIAASQPLDRHAGLREHVFGFVPRR